MKKNLKRVIPALIIAALPLGNIFGAVNVSVDGVPLELKADPVIEKGTTLLPMRPIFEELGLKLQWNDATKTVTGKSEDVEIKLTLGSKTAYVNGEPKTIPVPAKLIKGNTMVPVRFIADALENTIEWDKTTETINVFSTNLALLSPEMQNFYRMISKINSNMSSTLDVMLAIGDITTEKELVNEINKLKSLKASMDKKLGELSALNISDEEITKEKDEYVKNSTSFSSIIEKFIKGMETQDENLLSKALEDLETLGY